MCYTPFHQFDTDWNYSNWWNLFRRWVDRHRKNMESSGTLKEFLVGVYKMILLSEILEAPIGKPTCWKQLYRFAGIPPFSRYCKIIGRQFVPWLSAIQSCLSVVHAPTVHDSLSSIAPAQYWVLHDRVRLRIEPGPQSGVQDPHSDQLENVGPVVAE